jgi:KUP system potassium uptake protein
MAIEATGAEPQSAGRLGLLSVAALGVVFGDIGTSPLYTLKTVLDYTGPHPDQAATLGALSLILWTLFLITTVKYVNIAMRIDNDGEGGIIALMTLLGVKQRHRPLIISVGLFGAALIYGDGAITPAISVLSALEGVEQIAPSLQTYVLPAAAVILLALFAVQPFGTSMIGRAFGPIMLFWFAAIAALGVYGVLQHPSVFAALDPRYGLDYLSRGGLEGFLVLGGVFLCVTGAERSTPTWDISGRSRSACHGASSFFPPSFSTTRARPRSCLPARRLRATSSTGSAPRRC